VLREGAVSVAQIGEVLGVPVSIAS